MSKLPEIVFTFPACMGGVASFNYNIINYSKLIKGFRSKVIMIRPEEDTRPLFTDKIEADEVITFHYSFKDNQYIVQERLSKLLGDGAGAIVTDNALTIITARRFNNPKTIFSLLHDYYYVNQNIPLGNLADVCIAHSSLFSDAVFAANPSDFAGKSFYIPYGVSQLKAFPEKNNKVLNLVFIGRLDDGKGVMSLYNVDELLQQKNVKVNWNIIGKGPLKDRLHQQWGGKQNVQFFEPASTEAVYDILKSQDAFVFPTEFEGTPVSILECLANGIVTITNDLPGGIRDIVKDGIGYRCKFNDLPEFAQHIIDLDSDRALLSTMQHNCFELGQSTYDIRKNADKYFACFENYKQYKRVNKNGPPSMSRLDKKYIPNSVVKLIRNIR